MKKKILLLLAAVFTLGLGAYAQNKIGYVDVDYVLSQMPETKQIESDLKVHETQLQNQLQAKVQTFQTKAQEYQNNQGSMTEVIRADTERELTQMQQNIQQFQQDAQVSLQKKSSELLQPVYEKIGKAITDVAEEGQYDYILSTRVGAIDVILYAKQENDVSDVVLKKMGITPTASNN